MRRWIGTTMILTVATAAGLAFASWAQEDEALSCEDVCYEAEERCYATCGEDDVDCEERCDAKTTKCLAGCE